MQKRFLSASFFTSVIMFLFAAFLFAHAAQEVTEGTNGDPLWTSFDHQIIEQLVPRRTKILDLFFETATELGSALFLAPLAILVSIYFFISHRKREAFVVAFASATTPLLVVIIKRIVERARPDSVDALIHASGYSFPSGHSSGSSAIFGSIFFVVSRHIESSSLRILFRCFGCILILSIALSRIYLGVHFPSDVFAGICLGMATVACGNFLSAFIEPTHFTV